jgi:hypothetical protein
MRRFVSMTDVDFGTYHHSRPEESKRIRESAERAFPSCCDPSILLVLLSAFWMLAADWAF